MYDTIKLSSQYLQLDVLMACDATGIRRMWKRVFLNKTCINVPDNGFQMVAEKKNETLFNLSQNNGKVDFTLVSDTEGPSIKVGLDCMDFPPLLLEERVSSMRINNIQRGSICTAYKYPSLHNICGKLVTKHTNLLQLLVGQRPFPFTDAAYTDNNITEGNVRVPFGKADSIHTIHGTACFRGEEVIPPPH